MTVALAWGDIQNLVLNNLGRVGDANITSLLPLWAALIQQTWQHDRNYWFLKATAERNVDQTSQVYELPPGYKDSLNLYLKFSVANGDPANSFIELFPISDTDVIRTYNPVSSSTDKQQPKNYVLGVQSLTLWPWPDKQYTMRVTYWRDIDPPTASSIPAFQNYWMTIFPQLYTEAMTMWGFRYLGDQKGAIQWRDYTRDTLAALRSEHNARIMQSESMMTPRADVKGDNLQERGNASWTDAYYW